jgi:integrase
VDDWIEVKASTRNSAGRRKLDELKETPKKGDTLVVAELVTSGSICRSDRRSGGLLGQRWDQGHLHQGGDGTHALSKAFGRYLKKKAGNTDGKKTFHSFRHAMTDHLKNKMVSEWTIEEIEGRAGNTETNRRYSRQFRVPKI